MQVERIAEGSMEHSAILLTCTKRLSALKTYILGLLLSVGLILFPLTLSILGKLCILFCCLLIFKMTCFQKVLSGVRSECLSAWIHNKPDILLGMI